MASGNDFVYYEDHVLEKLPACTIKRQSKLDLNKSDMLQLLSYLEGELQARDIVVAALHAEKVKSMIHKANKDKKYPRDPILALQRDSELLQDCSYDESDVKSMYNDQLVKLENLITTQHDSQKKMRDIVSMVEKKYLEVSAKLGHDKSLYAKSIANDDSIVYALEKERERLKLELERENNQTKILESELSRLKNLQSNNSSESVDYELLAVQLIKEQTRLTHKLVKLQTLDKSLESELKLENEKVENLEKLLTAEEEKLMHEEASQEKKLSEFDFKKQQLMAKLSKAETQQKLLLAELEQLQQQSQLIPSVNKDEKNNVKQNFKVIPINIHPSSSSTIKTTQQQSEQQPTTTAAHSTKLSPQQQHSQQIQQHQQPQQHQQSQQHQQRQLTRPSTTTTTNTQQRIRSPNSNVPIPINNNSNITGNNNNITGNNNNINVNLIATVNTSRNISPQRPQTSTGIRKIVPPGSMRVPPPIPLNKPHIPNLLPQQKLQQNASSISTFKPQLK